MDSRKELLYKVQAADFAAHDLMLYLDTHPCCQSALTLYHEKHREAKELRNEYESKYGPLTAGASNERTPWQWIENPWVWERSNL
ncbi:MAG: spore coat protein CotJB [Clostridia bacterium]